MKVLSTMVGNEIRVNKGGPDSRTGRLLDYVGNFLVIQTNNDNESLIYINTDHIKSVTEFIGIHPNAVAEKYGEAPEYVRADSLSSLMGNLVQKLVQVNNGPDKVVGALMELTDEYIKLYVENEVVYVPMFHVKSIAPIYKNSGNNNKDKENQANEKEKK